MGFKGFLTSIGHTLKRIFGDAAKDEHIILLGLQALSPAVGALTGLIAGPTAADEEKNVLSTITTKLSLAEEIASGAETPEGVTLASTLTDVQENMGKLLNLANVKNSAHAEQITSVSDVVLETLEGLIKLA